MEGKVWGLLAVALGAAVTAAGCDSGDGTSTNSLAGLAGAMAAVTAETIPPRTALDVTPVCTQPVDAAPVAETVPGWVPGESRQFVLTKTRNGSAGEKSLTIEVDVEVVEVDQDGATLRWSSEAGFFEGMPGGHLVDDLVGGLGRLDLEYRADATGGYDRILNAAEIRQKSERVVDVFVRAASAADNEMAQRMAKARRTMVATFEAKMEEDLDALHAGYGIVLEPGEIVSDAVQMPSLSGTPVDATVTVERLAVPDEFGCVVVEMDIAFDPSASAEALAAYLGDFSDKPVPEKSLENLQLEIHFRSAYDPSSGWVVKAERLVEATTADSEKPAAQKTVIVAAS